LDHRGAGTKRVEVIYVGKAVITAGSHTVVSGNVALPAASSISNDSATETSQGAIAGRADDE